MNLANGNGHEGSFSGGFSYDFCFRQESKDAQVNLMKLRHRIRTRIVNINLIGFETYNGYIKV